MYGVYFISLNKNSGSRLDQNIFHSFLSDSPSTKHIQFPEPHNLKHVAKFHKPKHRPYLERVIAGCNRST